MFFAPRICGECERILAPASADAKLNGFWLSFWASFSARFCAACWASFWLTFEDVGVGLGSSLVMLVSVSDLLEILVILEREKVRLSSCGVHCPLRTCSMTCTSARTSGTVRLSFAGALLRGVSGQILGRNGSCLKQTRGCSGRGGG